MTVTYMDFALALLDDVLGTHDKPAEHDARDSVRLESLGYLIPEDGEEIRTTGCPQPSCTGTMYKTRDSDDSSQYICNRCGHIV